MAFAISEENPGLGFGIIRVWAAFSPFGHFCCKNIKMPIAIDITKLEGMAVNHLALEQIVAAPVGFVQRVTNALVPAQWPGAIARRNDDLWILRAFDKFTGANAAANRANLHRLEFAMAEMFEPIVSGQQ